MRRRTYLWLGLAALGLGSTVESGAYERIKASRGSNLGLANDPNALLSLQGVSDPGVAPSFTNRAASDIVLTLDAADPGNPDNIEFDVDNNGAWATVPVSFTIPEDATRVASINADSSTVDVEITGQITEDGEQVGRVSMTREFGVASQIQIEVGDARADGKSGRFRVGLTNTGTTNATIAAIGINHTTNQDVDNVGGKSPPDKIFVWHDTDTQLLSTPLEVDNANPNSADIEQLDHQVTLTPESDGGSEQTFIFDRFRTTQGKNADMMEETITFTLAFTDGSQTTLEATDERPPS